jgi:APA family basic amino acid/polyamine antiporter
MATNPLFATKSLEVLLKEMEGDHRLRRVLGPLQLTSLGVGAIIGTGIFVLTGVAAHDKTGPALMLSFVVSGLACIFAALCYAEFASMAPVAGSAYTYAYATLGELFAWIIGWDLILEYAVASSTVAHGWSHYFQDLINNQYVAPLIFHLHVPHVVSNAPFDFDPKTHLLALTGTWFDFPAIFVAAAVTLVLVWGIKESATFNTTMVAIKLAAVAIVIGVGAFYVNPANWHPFAPFGLTGVSLFGHTILGQTGRGGEPLGMLAGAATIFFAYIGFDSISTHAEEARNPQKDVPFGIITSLVLCTFLYIAVSAVLTGMVPYNQINIDAPVSNAFMQVGLPLIQLVVSAGALAGITSVLLVMMLSQPRIFLAMARDGLLPPFFSAVHPRFRTPWKSTILTGAFVGIVAALVPLRILAELVNIGTLLAFVIVCTAVLMMRVTNPAAKRPFRAPFMPLTAILGISLCVLLMFSLPSENWLRLIVWLFLGFAIYFGYGRHHSHLARGSR